MPNFRSPQKHRKKEERTEHETRIHEHARLARRGACGLRRSVPYAHLFLPAMAALRGQKLRLRRACGRDCGWPPYGCTETTCQWSADVSGGGCEWDTEGGCNGKQRSVEYAERHPCKEISRASNTQRASRGMAVAMCSERMKACGRPQSTNLAAAAAAVGRT